ncbi:MAG: tetratricopeptide repeat protein [Myxococcota bacterium]
MDRRTLPHPSMKPFFFALACWLVSAPLVSAQDEEASARALFREGSEAMNEGRFAEARDAFEASLERFPSRGTAFNLAVVLTRTGAYVEAIRHFDALIDRSYGRLSRPQRREVINLRRQARRQLAYLAITLEGSDALNVRVDGRRYEGRMPIDPGEHTLVITSPRHRPYEQAFVAERGEEVRLAPTLELSEDARLAGVILTTNVSGAELSIPGVVEGPSPIETQLEPGEYEIFVRAGEREESRTVQVEGGRNYTFDIGLANPGVRRRRRVLGIVGGVVAVAGIALAVALARSSTSADRDPVFGTITTLSAR